MPSNQEPAEFYDREADRLLSMAESFTFADVRDDLLRIARLYKKMASQVQDMSRRAIA